MRSELHEISRGAGVPIVCPRHETPTGAGPMDRIAVEAETADPDVIATVTSACA